MLKKQCLTIISNKWVSPQCKKGLILFFLLVNVGPFFFVPCRGVAAETVNTPWQITADRIENIKEPETIIAEGNVILQQVGPPQGEGLEIKGDRIEYDVKKNVVNARGNITVHAREDEIKADEALIDLDKQTGTFVGTTLYFKKHDLYFAGKRVEKTGEKTYRLEDGWISSCKIEPGKSVPWALTSSKSRVTIDGYAVLKHSTFQVKSIPVLYTPYLIFPAKVTRQTGFLFPEISHSSRDGFGFLAPLFINLSPSADMTLYPGHLEKRGGVGGIEFRYLADYDAKGTFKINYQHDRTTDTIDDDFKNDSFLRDIHDRYWYRGKVDHDFGDNLVGRLDIDVVSDRDYLQEYEEGMIGFRQSNKDFLEDFNRGLQEKTIDFRESTMQLSKTWPAVYLAGELKAVDNVLDGSAAPAAVHALPRTLLSTRLAGADIPVNFAWDSEYLNYRREGGLGTQRLDTHPRLIAPVPLGRIVEGKVATGVRQTAYRVDVHGDETWTNALSNSRTAWDMTANVATTFTRDFGLLDAITPKFSHTIRPNIGYSYVDVPHQDDLPDFDGVDRLDSENLIIYELYNYFRLGRVNSDGKATDRDFGRFKISQNYDIAEARRDVTGNSNKRQPFSDILFDLTLTPMDSLTLRYETALSVYGKGVTSYDLYCRYRSKRGDSLSVDYRYVLGTTDQLNLKGQLVLTDSLSVQGGIINSLLTDEIVESRAGIVYHPPCWAMELQYSETTDDERLFLVFTLEGVGKAFEVGKENI